MNGEPKSDDNKLECFICSGEHNYQECLHYQQYMQTPEGLERQKLLRMLWSKNDPEMASLWKPE